ncbi:MAG: membrane lipoprotein lipid attachment site-containing protein [Bacteroidales bacterium]|nr:membrane lipoprotein lipid attachment site-containing protein [Bacteroidales bacterium]
MKKILIALSVILLTLSGCVKKNPDGSYPLQENCGNGNNPYVVVIDSCEYIVWEPYRLAHKGNCKFCEERRKKEYEAFLENIIIELY